MVASIRNALPGDIAECVVLRGQTRENAVSVDRLRTLGITVETWGHDVRVEKLIGYVAHDGRDEGLMAGYCFGDTQSGEVVVLALRPAFEARGLGRRLLALVANDLRSRGHQRLFLGCSADPAHRSHGFYRHLGWTSTGAIDAHGDEVLEHHLAKDAPR